MIKYTIEHHVKGRIRIKVPVLRNISLSRLKGLSHLKIPEGIKDIKPNPLSGSVVILYEPSIIDIEQYLQSLLNDERIENLLNDI